MVEVLYTLYEYSEYSMSKLNTQNVIMDNMLFNSQYIKRTVMTWIVKYNYEECVDHRTRLDIGCSMWIVLKSLK